jgi:hypothetical protein
MNGPGLNLAAPELIDTPRHGPPSYQLCPKSARGHDASESDSVTTVSDSTQARQSHGTRGPLETTGKLLKGASKSEWEDLRRNLGRMCAQARLVPDLPGPGQRPPVPPPRLSIDRLGSRRRR